MTSKLQLLNTQALKTIFSARTLQQYCILLIRKISSCSPYRNQPTHITLFQRFMALAYEILTLLKHLGEC